MIVVAGGFYYEQCFTPHVRSLFGSAGRAAAALSPLTQVRLHTFFPPDFADDVIFNMAAFGVDAVVHDSPSVIEFFYHFPLSPPRIAPVPLPRAASAHVTGEKVLRFGCLEGEMVVDADIAVYDPQSGGAPAPFRANGSIANKLALVLNEAELFALSPASDMVGAVQGLTDNPQVVIVKSGPHGAFVFDNGRQVGQAPVFQSKRVYKIGSGDIFSASFSYHWMEAGLGPVDAAELASQHVAHYVETREPTIPVRLAPATPWVPSGSKKKVYLAARRYERP